MEQDLTFFAENGLTSTSANHIANLAKEYVKAQEQKLESVEFYNTYLTIIGSDKGQRVQRGCTSQQLDDIAVKLRDTIYKGTRAYTLARSQGIGVWQAYPPRRTFV